MKKKGEYGQKVNELKNEIKKLIEIRKLELSKQKSDIFLIKPYLGKLIRRGVCILFLLQSKK